MRRQLAIVAAAAAIVLSTYACSSIQLENAAQDGGPGDDGSLVADGAVDLDAVTDGRTSPDGTTVDAALDAALDAARDGDATVDATVDAMVDAEVDAGPPVVRFIGRFDMAPAAGPKVAWPGAQIIARFSGTTEVKATFADAMLFTDYGANHWEVFIDGTSTMTIQLDRAQPTTYTLASGLTLTPHTVELYKLTEGNVGTTQFQGFDFAGGTLLPPPLPKTRHLQFLGDSASAGYGIEGVAPCSFSAMTENERKTFPALLAHDLLADHHNLAASGKGVYYNNTRSDPDVFSIIYQRAGVSFFSAPLWDYTAYTPDVVWITLGANDFDGNGPPNGPPAGAFETKYDELVTTVRTQHPDAHVFCTVAPSLSDAYPAGHLVYTNVKTAAQNVVNAHAVLDNKIYYFEFTRSAGNGSDTTACDGHVNAAKHRAMADEAMVLIKAKTGW